MIELWVSSVICKFVDAFDAVGLCLRCMVVKVLSLFAECSLWERPEHTYAWSYTRLPT